jgi:hypothetical protein
MTRRDLFALLAACVVAKPAVTQVPFRGVVPLYPISWDIETCWLSQVDADYIHGRTKIARFARSYGMGDAKLSELWERQFLAWAGAWPGGTGGARPTESC